MDSVNALLTIIMEMDLIINCINAIMMIIKEKKVLEMKKKIGMVLMSIIILFIK